MDSYCSVYFTECVQFTDLIEKFLNRIEGRIIHKNSIEIESGFIDIVENKSYNEYLQYGFPDGFLYFKFKIEINFKQSVQITECIAVVTKILKLLWESNISAVAAADYEQFLPLNGGYNSAGIPWPINENNNKN
jgi:hypothetical protein